MANSFSLPDDLIVMRHGQSEGNLVRNLEKNGKPYRHLLTDAFLARPGSTWTLTEKGVAQARLMGAWLQPELDALIVAHKNQVTFPGTPRGSMGFQVSPFTRARQTAGHMALRNPLMPTGGALWRLNRTLRERDWGDIETMAQSDFEEATAYSHNIHKRRIDSLYWRPPGGESMAEVAESRMVPLLESLARSPHNVAVLVCHGEVMRALNMVIRRTNDEDYSGWDTVPSEKIRNCEVFHYSRFDPARQMRSDDYSWVRRARPKAVGDAHPEFVEEEPWVKFSLDGLLTNDELLQ